MSGAVQGLSKLTSYIATVGIHIGGFIKGLPELIQTAEKKQTPALADVGG